MLWVVVVSSFFMLLLSLSNLIPIQPSRSASMFASRLNVSETRAGNDLRGSISPARGAIHVLSFLLCPQPWRSDACWSISMVACHRSRFEFNSHAVCIDEPRGSIRGHQINKWHVWRWVSGHCFFVEVRQMVRYVVGVYFCFDILVYLIVFYALSKGIQFVKICCFR